MVKTLLPNGVVIQQRCGHDGQRKRGAHMPTHQQQQKTVDRNWPIIPTRLRDEAIIHCGFGASLSGGPWCARRRAVR